VCTSFLCLHNAAGGVETTADRGRGTSLAEGRLERVIVGVHVIVPHKGVGNGGAAWELLVPLLRSDGQEILALAAVVAVHNRGVVEARLLGARLGRRKSLPFLFIHAGKECDLVGRGRRVERANSGELPVAVVLLDARAGDGTDGRVEEPGDGAVGAEVFVQLNKGSAAKGLASGSPTAEVVTGGDRTGRR